MSVARALTVAALLLGLAPGALAAAQTVPAHCQHSVEAGPWPAVGEAFDTTETSPVTASEARARVRAFRAAWRRVPHPTSVLRSFTECMNASFEHFMVRRVSVAHARSAIAGLAAGPFASSVLSGSASSIPADGWVWEVYWGGGSTRHPPMGPVSAFFAPDGTTLLAAMQWPEG